MGTVDVYDTIHAMGNTKNKEVKIAFAFLWHLLAQAENLFEK